MIRSLKYLVYIMAVLQIAAPMIALAETEFGELVVAGDISPQERLIKKVDLTRSALSMAAEKTETMKVGLEKLQFLPESAEESLKNNYLTQVASFAAFYQERIDALNAINSIEEVDALIQTVIEYRETTYAPNAKDVLEFILIFSYGPSALTTATERFDGIRADVERLGGLNLIAAEQFAGVIDQCQTTLADASTLQAQAKELFLKTHPILREEGSEQAELAAVPIIESEDLGGVDPTNPIAAGNQGEPTVAPPPSARELAEESLNKITGLYNIFIETGQKVKETLGI